MIKKINLKTSKRNEMINITRKVRQIVGDSKIKEGLCSIYVRHTSAAITINENDDPKIQEDFLAFMSRLIARGGWEHDKSGRCDRSNGDAHIKSFLVGHSQNIPIEGGSLLLGKWQDIFLCEFDGPREREITVSLINSK